MGDIGKETDALLVEIPFVLAFDRFDLLSLLLLGTPHPVIQTDSDYDKRQYHLPKHLSTGKTTAGYESRVSSHQNSIACRRCQPAPENNILRDAGSCS